MSDSTSMQQAKAAMTAAAIAALAGDEDAVDQAEAALEQLQVALRIQDESRSEKR